MIKLDLSRATLIVNRIETDKYVEPLILMPIDRMLMIRSASGDQQTARDLQSKNPAAIISLQMAANGSSRYIDHKRQ